MELPKDLLKQGMEQLGFQLNSTMWERFTLYYQLLIAWNEKMNLTAIVDPREVVIKHFLDSLTVLSAGNVKQGGKLADIGSGAGFPALPIKILRPDLEITMMDSLQKRVLFLKEALNRLGLEGCALHMRAEEAGRNAAHREGYDVATARAVASMNTLCEYCMPLVNTGGIFVIPKGSGVEEEVDIARTAVSVLGGEIMAVRKFILPDDISRTVIVVEKISQTPTAYPRNMAKILKKPL